MIKLNGSSINVTMFPDNTSQVWKLPEQLLNKTNYVYVTWEFSHEGEFMHLAQLKMLLDKYNFRSDLSIKYLPYARQDKPISNDTTFALYAFARLLNTLEFSRVYLQDPHSKVAERMINNSVVDYYEKEIKQTFDLTNSDIMCYPDSGARNKYSILFPYITAIYGEKDRNPLTGWIEKYNLKGDPKGKSVLIVDDICDGGMTFILLTKELLKAGAKEVNLYVTHGIFSKGLGCLKESGINRIFTADGECSEVQEKIVIKAL